MADHGIVIGNGRTGAFKFKTRVTLLFANILVLRSFIDMQLCIF